MALTPRFIVDTSAAARTRHPSVRGIIAPLIELGLVASTPFLDAEALHSCRSREDFHLVRERRRLSYGHLAVEERDWEAAFDAQEDLARSGRHRAVGIADLITSVLAIRHQLIVIHYDSDFDIVSEVTTTLRHRWVVPRGSVP